VEQFLATILVITAIFAICITMMSVGLIIRGRKMRGGCGSSGHSVPVGIKDRKGQVQHTSCGFCAEKKKLSLCSSENKGDLKDVSKLNTLGRFDR